MRTREITVVRTGTANVASVCAAFRRLGARVVLTEDPTRVVQAAHLVVPGVGAFDTTMGFLRERRLDDAIFEHMLADKPSLLICLGLQLLCEGSAESSGCRGFGVIPAQVTRFDESVRVPHIGWNRVEPVDETGWLRSGYGYFANSYKLDRAPDNWLAACTTHGQPFVAALQRRRLLACQFHPELSGAWGLGILRGWLELSYIEGRVSC
jgi:imidazole glycerol phosphate synthase glutamine amidotransferase subunit